MRTLLILVLALSAASQADGFVFGIFDAIIDLGTNIVGNIFDWGITTMNKFVDTGFKIGGTALGFVVDPFGWFKPSEDDHGHLTGKVAKCPARSDILFVFDTSGSMSSNQFDLSKKFATRLTEHFQISNKDVRFAAIKFGSSVEKVFDFNTYDNHGGISLSLALTGALGGSTKTYLALDYIRNQNLFSTSKGARDVSSKIVIVITDGSSDSLLSTNTAADALKRLYHVISVGIGSGLGLELHNIASNYRNVFTADNFDNLLRIEQRVARRLCEIPEADGNIPTTGSGIGGSKCPAGFEKNSKNPSACSDINECKTGHSCQDQCINTVGSYRCTCRAGYAINPTETNKCLKITQCPALVDIVFVLDASGSIGSENFKTQQTFVAKLTHHFNVGPRGALFGGLLFATDVYKLFDINTYTSRTDVTTSLLGAEYIQGGTNTHLALRYISENGMFSPASGGRREATDIVVIVTDGDASNQPSAKAAADALKSQGVQVFAVGIGEQADLVKLADLASKSTNVIGVMDFDLLDYIQQSLADSICSSVTASAANALKSEGITVMAVGIGSGAGIELHAIASGSRNVFRADSFNCLVRIEQKVARRTCEIPEAQGCVPSQHSSGVPACQKGFVQSPSDPETCVDDNECESRQNPCQQECVNLVGSFRCACRDGFAADPSDTTKCKAIQTCAAVADIIFVLDASGSIGSDNFEIQQKFVAKLTHHFAFGRTGVLFAALLFSTDVQKLFDFNTYQSRVNVSQALLTAPYLTGVTNTHKALAYIRQNGMFTATSGGRSTAADIVIVLTDGQSSVETETTAEAANLKQDGVIVISIGIGNQISTDELGRIASSSQDALIVDDFDWLSYIELRVSDRACRNKTPS